VNLMLVSNIEWLSILVMGMLIAWWVSNDCR
jgi:hypothetical protein